MSAVTHMVLAASGSSFTKLLLHMDGADASTTFTDSSQFGVSVTANGNAQVDTAQSKFGGASGLFDGTGDYLSWSHSSQFDLGTSAFTIDFWVRFNSTSGTQAFYAARNNDAGTQKDFVGIYKDATNLVFLAAQNAVNVANYSKNWSPSTGVWYHIAIVRNGTSLLMFIDGVEQAPTASTAISTNSLSPTFGTPTQTVARYGDFDGFYVNGWIDEFRFSKGIARWTANFTPPTTAYSSD
jgi:hypothetical protein